MNLNKIKNPIIREDLYRGAYDKSFSPYLTNEERYNYKLMWTHCDINKLIEDRKGYYHWLPLIEIGVTFGFRDDELY